jgi:hypothetical protein
MSALRWSLGLGLEQNGAFVTVHQPVVWAFNLIGLTVGYDKAIQPNEGLG